MRFHVLGLGSIGTLISHHLRAARPKSPISLIVKSAKAFTGDLRRLRNPGVNDSPVGATLHVQRGRRKETSRGFDVESWGRSPYQSSSPQTVLSTDYHPHGRIDSLIVCLKAGQTLEAVGNISDRLHRNSVITLLQNGMGVYDELCAGIWPDPASRPFFILGSTTHGVKAKVGKRGDVVHVSPQGQGDIKWGLVPDPRKEIDLESWIFGRFIGDRPILSPPFSPKLPLPPIPTSSLSRGTTKSESQTNSTGTDLGPLRETLTGLISLELLNPSLLPMKHLHHALLLKLALNATINPLTAVIAGGTLPNGTLLSSRPSYRLIKILCGETSTVLQAYIRSLSAPLEPPPELLRMFSEDALAVRIHALCRTTAENISSMATDTSNGRPTEIKYINGYLVSLAERLRIPTPSHKMIIEMVKFTASINGMRERNAEGSQYLERSIRDDVTTGTGVTRDHDTGEVTYAVPAWLRAARGEGTMSKLSGPGTGDSGRSDPTVLGQRRRINPRDMELDQEDSFTSYNAPRLTDDDDEPYADEEIADAPPVQENMSEDRDAVLSGEGEGAEEEEKDAEEVFDPRDIRRLLR